MAKIALWASLVLVVSGCDGSESADDGGGASGGSSATGGSAGAGVTGGSNSTGGTSGSGAGFAGSSFGGMDGMADFNRPGLIETGPDCRPLGPDTIKLGAAYETVLDEIVGSIVALESGPSGTYAATTRRLYRIAPGSATPELVVEDDDFGSSNSPGADGMLRVDATHVYWASSTDVRRASVDDFTVETIVPDIANIDFLELDAESIYFCVRETNVIYKAPLAGGAAVEISNGQVSVQDMKVHAGYVYVSDFTSGQVVRFPVAGGELQSVSPVGLFLLGNRPSADTVYWADDGGLNATPLTNPTAETHLSSPTNGGPFGVARVNNIVLRGDRLFWLDSDGSAGWTKTDGSQCDLTVRAGASEFAVDDTYLYVDHARVAY